MIRDITIGQYYPANSKIHKLDPRVKFIGTVVYLVSLFLVSEAGYLICAAALALMIIISKVPLRFMVKGLKAVFIILILTMLLNLFLTQGDVVIWQWQIFKITDQGIKMAVSMGVRMVFLILGASLMTLTTTPNKLTDGLEKLLSPLKIIKVPVHETAMIMSIALRFIPILLDEADRIIKAQTARGADFESGNLVKKAKAMIPVLVPLFIAAFRRANDLALAMEARCYHGGEGRTHMKPLVYHGYDYAAYCIIAMYLACVITLKIIFGW